jgi:hypothetical protein
MRGERGCVRIDFLGIGAQKAATSWLHVQLANHPQVRFPAVKETHFWDNRAGRDVREWFAMFAATPPAVIQGEITPAYGPLSEAVIREIAHAAPGVRTFYSLRNPMERAWSAAVMELERADRTRSQVPDTWFIDHFHSNASRARGDYAGTLRRWRKVLGDDAVLVLWFDEICRDPRSVLVRLAEYLRIDDEFFRERSGASLERPIFAGPGEMVRPSLRRELRHLYAESILELEAYLEVDLAHWRSFETDGAEGKA